MSDRPLVSVPHRIYLYFFLFGVIAFGVGAWAVVSQDPNAMAAAEAASKSGPNPLDPSQLAQCNQINKFLSLFSLVYAPVVASYVLG